MHKPKPAMAAFLGCLAVSTLVMTPHLVAQTDNDAAVAAFNDAAVVALANQGDFYVAFSIVLTNP
jgi:hypothetical protein